jgi:hypothetical protein
MDQTLQKIVDLMTGENGSILFHILLFIPILLTAQMAWINRKAYSDTQQKRLGIGFSALFALQSMILGVTALFFPVSPEGQLFPAILERCTTISILIILFWLWVVDENKRIIDISCAGLLGFSLLFFILTLTAQNQTTIGVSYNGTWFDFTWQVFSILVTLLGIILLAIQRPASWKTMFFIAGVHLSGFLLHITLTGSTGNFSTIVRLAQLCSYPLIPGIFFFSASKQAKKESLQTAIPIVQPVESVASLSPEIVKVPVLDYPLLHIWTSILEDEKPEKILISVCSALAHTLKADLCFIISGDAQQNELVLQGGFDLIREVEKAGGTINKSKLPQITKALENEENLQLTIETDEPEDVQTLRSALALDSEMNLLLMPMPSKSGTKSAVLLLSPYSKRIWSKEEQHQIEPVNHSISILFEHLSDRIKTSLEKERLADQNSELDAANQEWQKQYQEKDQELLAQKVETDQFQQQLLLVESKIKNMVEKSQYEKIATRHQQNQAEIERLRNNNEELRAQLEELKNALVDFDPQESLGNLPKVDGSSEVESMLAIQLESQEVISRLHEKNLELQKELDGLTSSLPSRGDSSNGMEQVTLLSLYETKKAQWLDQIESTKYQAIRRNVILLSTQFDQFLQQVSLWDQNHDKRKATGMLVSLKQKAESMQNYLQNNIINDNQITFPQLLDEIFEDLNETVMQQDLTLKVDIPEEMNDIPVPDHKITHLLKTLLQDLVHSLQQDGWLSIKIEKQILYLSIHVSLSCSENIQAIIMDILNKQQITNEHFENHFGLLLTKDLVENMQGIIESTQNTMEQTNLYIRLPIHETEETGHKSYA